MEADRRREATSVNAIVSQSEKKEEKKEQKKPPYRVIKSLPAFVGPDMKTYELKEGMIVDLPAPLDRFLIEKGIVQKS
jgi:hypothetical protein